jgi:hypothetical protein
VFSVYCPGHQAQVLLDLSRVRRLEANEVGYELSWVCWCGSEGVRRIAVAVRAA